MADDSELSTELRSLLNQLAQAPARPLDAPLPKLAGDRIGRYQLEEAIGQGGFGVVFAARDQELERRVAVKITRGEPTPEALERFQSEARLAARLNHPNLVTLHDFGVVAGLPYLVLELLDGETLAERLVRGPLPLAEAVETVSDVLRALEHAHAAGVLHLDLKPSNVFITSDGRVKVLDFGLAQLRGASPGTRRAGTPGYMAPEQWRGAPTDATTDLYSVGVMLYAALAGELPFPSRDNGAAVLDQAPAPPVPRGDGRTRAVVARALAKDPTRRYRSAREMQRAVLALVVRGRFLRLAAVGAVLLAAAAAGGLLWRGRRVAVEDARFAAHAATEAQAIEAQLRYARLQPLHDVRPDEAAARRRLAALTTEVEAAGDVGAGAGELEVGRAALALGDLADARLHLERAVQRGDRTAAVNEVLGRTLLAQYQVGVREARRNLLDVERRKSAFDALGSDLRDPALAYLRAAQKDTPLALARIAYLAGQNDDAERQARAAFAAEPGLYEAATLAGEAQMAKAAAAERSTDWAGLIEAATRAGEHYAAALTIARSDPALLSGECRRWNTIHRAQTARGEDGAAAFQHADEACRRALVAEPLDPDSTVELSNAIRQRADELNDKGEDSRPLLIAITAALAEVEAAHPGSTVGPAATIAMARARAEDRHGNDPRPWFDAAERALATAHSLSNSYVADHLTVELIDRADYEDEHGIDPSATVARILLLTRNQENGLAMNSGARALTTQGRWEAAHGKDPRPSLSGAAAMFARIRARRPDDPIAADEEGGAWEVRAGWEDQHGVDPRPSLDHSIACSNQVLRISPNDLQGHGNLGEVLIERAEAERHHGGDARPFLAQARAHLDRALAVDPQSAAVMVNLALLSQRTARSLVDGRSDPSSEIKEARAWLARAQKIRRDDASTLPIACDLERDEAGWAIMRHRSPAANFSRAVAACKAARALDPDSAPRAQQAAELEQAIAKWKGL